MSEEEFRQRLRQNALALRDLVSEAKEAGLTPELEFELSGGEHQAVDDAGGVRSQRVLKIVLKY